MKSVQLEHLFLGFGLLFGLLFLLLTPPFQEPDGNLHFFRSYQISEGQLIEIRQGSQIGGNLPTSLTTLSDHFVGLLRSHPERKTNVNDVKEFFHLPLNPEERTFTPFPSAALYFPIVYFPQVIGIWTGRLLHLPPLGFVYLARVFNLCLWTFLVFMALQNTPIFKGVFFLLALTPMSMFQAASLSADAFTNGASMLLIALCLRYSLIETARIKRIDLVLLALLSLTVSLSKLVYFLIPFLIFLIPPRKFGGPKKYGLSLAGILGGSLFFVGLWLFALQDFNIPHPETSLDVSIPGQLFWILHHPVPYAFILGKTFWVNFSTYVVQFLGLLGWLDTLLPPALLGLCLLSLSWAILIDHNEEIGLDVRKRAILLGVFLPTVLILSTVLFLTYTPVGAGLVKGLQGRYFIPVAPLFFLLFYHRRGILKPLTYRAIAWIPPLTLSWTLWVLKKRYFG